MGNAQAELRVPRRDARRESGTKGDRTFGVGVPEDNPRVLGRGNVVLRDERVEPGLTAGDSDEVNPMTCVYHDSLGDFAV